MCQSIEVEVQCAKTARLRQSRNRKCLNILYRQSHVAARAGGGFRLCTLQERLSRVGLVQRQCAAPTGKGTELRQFVISLLCHSRCSPGKEVCVCYIFAVGVSFLRYRDHDDCVPCSSTQKKLIRVRHRRLSRISLLFRTHSTDQKVQPRRAWQPAQGHNVCPSA